MLTRIRTLFSRDPLLWRLFLLLQAVNVYELAIHAMWRDELQIWSIVLASRNLPELFSNMRYDGFPPLWYLFLWGASFLSSSPVTMKAVHYAFSLSAQLLIMTRSPFSRGMKLAVLASYYLSFEYCVISRAYVLGVLLVFLYCAHYAEMRVRSALRGLLLGLLANTSVYGAILSIAFALEFLFTATRDRADEDPPADRSMATFIAIYLSFLAVSISFMMPPADATFYTAWNFAPEPSLIGTVLCRNLIAMVPLPLFVVSFWNTLALMTGKLWLDVPAALCVAVAVFVSLRRTPRYLLLFVTGFMGIWIFSFVKFVGSLRHAGTAMVLYLACLWLASAAGPERRPSASRASAIAVWCVLAINCLAWATASFYHLNYDFSGSRKTAELVRRQSSKRLPIVADSDDAASAVAGYLGQKIFYATTGRPGTFLQWNKARAEGGPYQALALARQLSLDSRGPVLLLFNYETEGIRGMRLVGSSDQAIVSDEVFHLYEYEPEGR